jgi:bifunctional enzyme CysN/CysC
MANSDILRFATAGSVDDGKSSLIGRLLYDSKSILEDQMLAIENASKQRGSGELELALLTDGLRAEREQNITIDVAYRYFATAKRKFIIADTPGHLQYTRNMVTGASTADLSVILIDARKGVLNQSKRHAAISALLGIRHLVVAINKMDLIGFSEAAYCQIVCDFGSFARKLGVSDVTFIPVSALLGDNVVDKSENMPWYEGPTLLGFLEQVDASVPLPQKLRLPIQFVIRPNQDYRGFAGPLVSGSLQVGDTVQVASTGLHAIVRSLRVAGVEAEQAVAGQAVAVSFDREIDVSRGDLLHSPSEAPEKSNKVEAIICWMHESALGVGKGYLLHHTTRRVPAIVEQVIHRIDVDTFEPDPSPTLGLNDLGRVVLRTASPLFFDRYADNPGLGSFVLVDPSTHATVAGGMLHGVVADAENWSDAGPEGFASEAASLAADIRRFAKRDAGQARALLEAILSELA